MNESIIKFFGGCFGIIMVWVIVTILVSIVGMWLWNYAAVVLIPGLHSTDFLHFFAFTFLCRMLFSMNINVDKSKN